MSAKLFSPAPALPQPRAGWTPRIEAEQRAAVIREALSWVRTPYRQCGAHKGGGVDCAMLLVRVWIDAGVIEEFDPRPYPPEWHLHNSEERYLGWMMECASITEAPQPGDLVLFWYGRCFSHSGIMIGNDQIVHAPVREGMVRISELRAPEFRWIDAAGKRPRPRLYFDVWARIKQLAG